MSKTRYVEVKIMFHNKDTDETRVLLDNFLESFTYSDVAKGSSDTVDLQLLNAPMKFLNEDCPELGAEVIPTLTFHNWNGEGDDFVIECGNHVLTDISFSGSPSVATFSGTSIPSNASFTSRRRTKTWRKAKVKAVASKIARRYRLRLSYKAPKIVMEEREQTLQTDAAFLEALCSEYNLGLKVRNDAMIIFDQGQMEQEEPVATLRPDSFIDGAWSINDTLGGVYNGARISFKKGETGKKKNKYFGKVAEGDAKARTLFIDQTADNKADAKLKAMSEINRSNESITTISGDVWPDGKLAAGACVNCLGFGRADGKYYIEKLVVSIGGGSRMSLEMHKCQERIRRF